MSDAWKEFETTGKVEDYLAFCEVRQKEKRRSIEDRFSDAEDRKYGKEHHGYRDGAKCHADW